MPVRPLAPLILLAGASLAVPAPALAEQEGGAAKVAGRKAGRPGPTVAAPSQYLRGTLKSGGAAPLGAGTPRTAPGPAGRAPGVVVRRRGVASRGIFEPSDSTGSAGPGAYVEFTNERVAVARKRDLRMLRRRGFDAFLGSPGGNVADPQIQWDEQGGRWLYAAIRSKGETGYLEYGWSQTADPGDLRRGWCHFTVRTGSNEPDYPKLGHSDRYLVVGANVFKGGDFKTAALYVARKPVPGERGCRSGRVAVFGTPKQPLTTADGDPAFTPEPVNLTERSGAGYVVAADDPFVSRNELGHQLMIWHVIERAGRTVLVQNGNVAVPDYRVSPDVPQRGSSSRLDSASFAAALTQAVGRSDPAAGGRMAIWTQHTVRSGKRSAVRWYELLPGGRRPRQTGIVRLPGRYVFNGAVSPAGDGTGAALVYNSGSAQALPDVRVQRRSGAMALGRMGGEQVVARSTGARTGCSPSCSWGDYAAASPDPRDLSLVWGSSQIQGRRRADNGPQWVTVNFAISTGPGAAIGGLGARSPAAS